MSDWVKILVSALAGVVTGIMIEPLKSWVSLRVIAGQAKRAIYYEMARMYFFFQMFEPDAGDFSRVITDAFDFYYSQKREAFYRLRHWDDIIALYREVKRLQKGVLSEEVTVIEAKKVIRDDFELRFKAGVLDKALLMHYVDRFNKRVMKYVNVKIASEKTTQ